MNIRISTYTKQIFSQVERQLRQRSAIAAQELRNASLEVLSGSRGGRSYVVPGTGRVRYYKRTKTAVITHKRYTGSSPGEPPAVRTGTLRRSWRPITFGESRLGAAIESNVRYAGWLEHGTHRKDGGQKMAPRPFEEKIIETAKPKIEEVYSRPFNISL